MQSIEHSAVNLSETKQKYFFLQIKLEIYIYYTNI